MSQANPHPVASRTRRCLLFRQRKRLLPTRTPRDRTRIQPPHGNRIPNRSRPPTRRYRQAARRGAQRSVAPETRSRGGIIGGATACDRSSKSWGTHRVVIWWWWWQCGEEAAGEKETGEGVLKRIAMSFCNICIGDRYTLFGILDTQDIFLYKDYLYYARPNLQ